MLRKKSSETSLLKVWVYHCTLPIYIKLSACSWHANVQLLTIIGFGLISILAREGQTLDECHKSFHVDTLKWWWRVMRIDNSKLILLQRANIPRELKGRPSRNSPVLTSVTHYLTHGRKSSIPSGFFSDLVRCDVGQIPAGREHFHDPAMNIFEITC